MNNIRNLTITTQAWNYFCKDRNGLDLGKEYFAINQITILRFDNTPLYKIRWLLRNG